MAWSFQRKFQEKVSQSFSKFQKVSPSFKKSRKCINCVFFLKEMWYLPIFSTGSFQDAKFGMKLPGKFPGNFQRKFHGNFQRKFPWKLSIYKRNPFEKFFTLNLLKKTLWNLKTKIALKFLREIPLKNFRLQFYRENPLRKVDF